MNQYRVVIKNKAGFLSIVDKQASSPYACLTSFHMGVVHTIEEKHGENYFTVFTLKGPRVYIASKDIYESSIIPNYYPKTDIKRVGKPVTEYDHENKIYSHA